MRPVIAKLAKMLTDCMDVKTGLVKMSEDRWEYKMLDALLTDEMAELMLKMGRRRPATAAELAKKTGWDEPRVQSLLDDLCDIGLAEYNRHNADRHKQYVVPIFVVGSAENLVLNKKLLEKHPEIAEFFYQMAEEPLKLISHMVPPGGAGLGFHAIPVERAIPKESRALSIEQLSYWLEKYRGQLSISDCVCRTSMILRGEGCGELPDKGCIQVGDYADYLVETGKAERASYDEVIALLKRSEENGFMHQVTNGDGGEDIFAICNCSVGNCFALRCSQLFNNPNGSASAYRAVVDRDKCVACGKCAEVCPAGAVRLGRKLETKNGPVSYENEPLAFETKGWSEKNWHPDYRDRNQINCYPGGTAPCKCACPAHVSIQGVLQLVREERHADALKLLRQDNPFPSICREACDRRCEKVCMRGSVDSPMEIGETMARLADREEALSDELVPTKVRLKGENKDYELPVAVVGAGYAQLSCAYFLAQMSYPVTVFGTAELCSAAEREIMERLGVRFSEGAPEEGAYAAVYPGELPIRKKDPAGLIEEGHEAAKTIHRSLHPGHSKTLARDPRAFRAFRRDDAVIPIEKCKAHDCLSCGVSYVAPNRCIGCGICTTRCFFGAIRLERSHGEFADYCSADDTVKKVVLGGVRRAGRIAIKSLKGKS